MSGYIVFFDFETGGIAPEKPEIQLAAIACDSSFKEIASFESKIKFSESDADPEALALNHYDPEAWKDAPSSGYVISRFARFIDPFRSVQMTSKRTGNPYSVARLAGHNAVGFDAPRLRRMFERNNAFMPCHPIPLDTLQLALWHFESLGEKPESLKLSVIAEYFGIDTAGAHDALTDVRLSAKIARELMARRAVAAVAA